MTRTFPGMIESWPSAWVRDSQVDVQGSIRALAQGGMLLRRTRRSERCSMLCSTAVAETCSSKYLRKNSYKVRIFETLPDEVIGD